jgi:hypothetical protein
MVSAGEGIPVDSEVIEARKPKDAAVAYFRARKVRGDRLHKIGPHGKGQWVGQVQSGSLIRYRIVATDEDVLARAAELRAAEEQ